MIDLRSDTVTQPTPAMRQAMAAAKVGDDQREGDPTTRNLQERAAELLGMDGALYVPSGTMANLIAVYVHTQRANGVVFEADSHITTVEAIGLAQLTPAKPYLVRGQYGVMDVRDVEAALARAERDGVCVGTLCLENTHNNAGATVVPEPDMKRLIALAKKRGLAVHVDGARIFNASVATGIPAVELVQGADSAMFCISKGLGAPVGSVLCGKADFITAARKVRTWWGGAMRQSGVIAAAGLVGLQDYPARFAVDHANARRLAEGLAALETFKIDMHSVQTNMVYIKMADSGFDASAFDRHCYERGVWVKSNRERFRLVLHHQVSATDVERALATIKSYFAA